MEIISKKIFWMTLRCLFLIFSPLIIVEAVLILIRSRQKYKNRIVYPFWHWSFGHQISGLDYAARLYYPHRISLILLLDPRNNPQLHCCYPFTYDSIIWKPILLVSLQEIPWLRARLFDLRKYYYRALKAASLMTAALFDRFIVIDRDDSIYTTLAIAKEDIFHFDNRKRSLAKYTNYTGYARLINQRIGIPPVLPQEIVNKVEEALESACPGFTEKPFVTLQLRAKGLGSSYDDESRNSGSQANYKDAVEFLLAKGLRVLWAGAGETGGMHFSNLSGFVLSRTVRVDPALINLYSLMQCFFWIGAHSGPNNLVAISGIPAVICDAPIYGFGTLSNRDVFLYKKIMTSDGRVLMEKEIYESHFEIAAGANPKLYSMSVADCSPEDILEAVKETYELLCGERIITPEENSLIRKYKESLPSNLPVRYYPCRIPLFRLHANAAAIRHSVL